MPGGVSNKQMMMNAKVRTMQRHLVDLTTDDEVYIGECADTDIAITSVRCRIENAATNGATQISVGHGVHGSTDIDSIVAAGVIATAKAEGYEETFTLDSELVNLNVKEAKGFPIVPKGEPIYADLDGVPTTGAGTVTIDYFPLDESSY